MFYFIFVRTCTFTPFIVELLGYYYAVLVLFLSILILFFPVLSGIASLNLYSFFSDVDFENIAAHESFAAVNISTDVSGAVHVEQEPTYNAGTYVIPDYYYF